MFSDTIVILAAGRGTRMQSEKPKVLLKVADKPILQHVLDYWSDKIRNYIFVVGYRSGEVVDFITSLHAGYLKHFSIVYQNEQKGIAHAIMQVKDFVSDKFIVALGDCIAYGNYNIPAGMEQGYAVWKTEQTKAMELGCTVKVKRGLIIDIREKSDVSVPGIGTYFFNRKVFDYIKGTNASSIRNEVEISDVMKRMLQAGEKIHEVEFYGDFINCTTPKDLEYAESILRFGAKV